MSLGNNLSKRLRKFRAEEQQRSQQWLADLIGVSRATINRWETKGAGSVTLDELAALGNALGLSISELLELEPKNSASLIRGAFLDVTGLNEEEIRILSRRVEELRRKHLASGSKTG